MTSTAQMTKAELIELLEEKTARTDLLEQQVSELSDEVSSLNASGAGWLVESPSALFVGTTMGIQFINGQAFIRKNQTVDACILPPMKRSTMDKFGYTKEEREAIREREAQPSSEKAARLMEFDHHYKVTFFDGSESSEETMKKLVDKRAIEYSQAIEALEVREKAANAMMPHVMGT